MTYTFLLKNAVFDCIRLLKSGDIKITRNAAAFVLISICGSTKSSGGAERDRTADPLLAKQVLSQLSYSPVASALDKWWVWEDLNFRPHPYQGCALTN